LVYLPRFNELNVINWMKRSEVQRLIDARYTSLVSEAIESIRALPAENRQSGDDSVLGDVWLEYASQIQGEHSWMWHAYVTTVEDICCGTVAHLTDFEVSVLWLASDGYWDWLEERAPSIGQMRDDVTAELRQRVDSFAANLELPRQ